jgi:AbrB family looped-hinge helix DNA binding protein
MSEMITVSTKGQITIPAALRERYGIKAGDRVFAEACENGFLIKKPLDIFELQGFLSGTHIPDDEEDLLTSEMGRHIMERG